MGKRQYRKADRKLTTEKVERFLELLVSYGGNITAASEESGVPRGMIYELEGEDPEFAVVFREAQKRGLGVLEDEARRRAFQGVARPVFHKGEECGAVQEYSDTLLIFLLKGGMPEKYKDRSAVDVNILSLDVLEKARERAKQSGV